MDYPEVDEFKLSLNWWLREATRSRSHPETEPENRALAVRIMPKLVAQTNLMEKSRSIIGAPLEAHSWLRCDTLNQLVGGSAGSQHREGLATDFSELGPDTYDSIEKTFNKLLDGLIAANVMFGQLIVEHGKERESKRHWIHLSSGHPLRALGRCREVLRYSGGKYDMLERLSVKPWRP